MQNISYTGKSLLEALGGFQLLDLIIPELKSHVIPGLSQAGGL